MEEHLEPQVTIVDWVSKDDVQKEMRRLIKRPPRVGLRRSGQASTPQQSWAEPARCSGT
jgi:hypothetical protein